MACSLCDVIIHSEQSQVGASAVFKDMAFGLGLPLLVYCQEGGQGSDACNYCA